jgi:hypothetical protein
MARRTKIDDFNCRRLKADEINGETQKPKQIRSEQKHIAIHTLSRGYFQV